MARTDEQSERWGALMAAAQTGDAHSYEALLREIQSMLRGYFRRQGADQAQADDLVQETLLSIHRARHTYLPEKPFHPWLFAIARNKLIDMRRARRTTIAVDETSDFSEVVETLEGEDGISTNGAWGRAIAALTAKQRQIVDLLKLKGLSVKTVAARLDMTESDVKVTAHRARKALIEKLEL